MKKIHVDVPENFQVPESLCTQDAHKVITIGDIMYTKGIPFLAENDPQHSKVVRDVSIKHSLEMKHMHDKMEQLTCSHGEQVQSIMQMNNSLQEQIERMSREYTYVNSQIRDEKDAIINTLREKTSESNIEIIQKIDSLLGSGNNLDNIEKGNFGEQFITQSINNEFPESVIDDVSGETAHGDCIWKMDSGSFRCLVEVKNVAQSKNLDVGKFVRDMNVQLSNGEANCGIFVSLKTDNIPNKGKFKLEYIQNYPVIYVSGVWKNPIVFTFTMRLMKYILQHHEHIDNQVDVIHIQEYMMKTYANVMKQQEFIQDMRRIIDRTNLLIQKAQKNVTESILYMEETMTRHGVSHESDGTHDEVIDKLIEFKQTYGKWPTASTCKISKDDYSCSFKDLLQRAKGRYNN
tara:strand:+ start:8904 stop:10115 length:1212 start_codon:yes stop_codon:yes gene_type:complete